MHKLWVRHPAAPGFHNAFSPLHVELARMSEPDAEGAPLFVPTDFHAHPTFRFLTLGRTDLRPFEPTELLARPENGPARDHRVLCTALSPSNDAALRDVFPEAEVEPNPLQLEPRGGGPRQRYAWILRIPAAALLEPEGAERLAPMLHLIRER